MGRISGRPWGIPVAAYGENPMATDRRIAWKAAVSCRWAASLLSQAEQAPAAIESALPQLVRCHSQRDGGRR